MAYINMIIYIREGNRKQPKSKRKKTNEIKTTEHA